jgi:hypothetical protein
MSRGTKLSRLAAAVFLFLAVGSAALSAATFRFRATFEAAQLGEPEPSSRCPDGQVLVRIEGRGTASRIGRVSLTMSHCIIDDPAEPDFTNGEMVLTSVRGDAIFIQYAGTDTPAGEGTSVIDGTFAIVGGSGAYAGATGGGTLAGTGSTSGSGNGVLNGTITLP